MLKSECRTASPLTQNATATALAPPKGIRFLKTMFLLGVITKKKMCPCVGRWQERPDTQ
ncbi:hypothetical protein I79_007193 [Cricetulus griseus]|uniref:Uncharacterized protein n=1 Tax=Cricetulus griseus TaxID=10029 RepID=G3H9W2_CRIGR|nr:hypothetical protein I79_007193 [Cricetulus griseus]